MSRIPRDLGNNLTLCRYVSSRKDTVTTYHRLNPIPTQTNQPTFSPTPPPLHSLPITPSICFEEDRSCCGRHQQNRRGAIVPRG